MTPEQIQAAVAASPALQAFRAAGNYEAMANSLTQTQPKVVVAGPEITTRGAAAAYPSLNGLPGALAFQLAYKKLVGFAATAKQSNAMPTLLLGEAIELQLLSFRDKGLDFGAPALRQMLDIIVAGSAEAGAMAFTVAEAQGFKDLALQTAPPVLWQHVMSALGDLPSAEAPIKTKGA